MRENTLKQPLSRPGRLLSAPTPGSKTTMTKTVASPEQAVTPKEVLALTDMDVAVAPDVRAME